MMYYDVKVPANTTATLYLPATGEVNAPDEVTVVGTVIHNGMETTQIELPSGSWHFGMGEGSIQAESTASISFPNV